VLQGMMLIFVLFSGFLKDGLSQNILPIPFRQYIKNSIETYYWFYEN